jgi:hypothetical protein
MTEYLTKLMRYLWFFNSVPTNHTARTSSSSSSRLLSSRHQYLVSSRFAVAGLCGLGVFSQTSRFYRSPMSLLVWDFSCALFCMLFLCDFRLFFIDVNVPLSLHLFRFIPPLSLPFLIQTDQFKCPDSISSDKGRGWHPKKKRLLLHALSRVWTNYCQVHWGSSFACVHFPRRIRSEEWEEVVGPLLDQGQLRQQRHWTSFE